MSCRLRYRLILLVVLTSRHTSLPADGSPPVERGEAVLIADSFARIHWKMGEANRLGRGRAEAFTSEYPVGPRIGMGYKWGAWESVDEFLKGIEMGKGTGTGRISYREFPFDSLSGISCAGLVSRAWKLEQKYTLTYPDLPNVSRQFYEITRRVRHCDPAKGVIGDLKKGDALENPSFHIILFIYETRDGFPMVIDSRSEGVRFRKSSWEELQDYAALKYRKITEDHSPPGTMDNPLFVGENEFPYIHKGNTRNVVSMEIDHYSVAGNSNQQGPEVIYKLELSKHENLEIGITDWKHEGIDNDIFLLESLTLGIDRLATDCITRGDYHVKCSLSAGTYYIVIDSGHDLPGEYVITIGRSASSAQDD